MRATTAPLREVYEDSGSRSAAGVAAYPTRPPAPADSRALRGDDAGDRLRSSEPWWLVRNGRGAASAAIAGDFDCDVAVIGAGMTGALIAHGLAEDGHEVVVLDRRDRALGSTAASTALLQYELDTMLTELSRLVGPVRACRAYQACVDAIGLLDALDERLGRCADFSRCESLYLSTQRRDRPRLLEEMRLRQESGIHCVASAASFGEKLEPAHAWAGHFASTADGLPFVGSWPGGSDNIVYALCLGGNGMVYAASRAR